MPDDRSQREKLEAMAHQKASPNEAKVAQHLLFKKYGGHAHGRQAAEISPEKAADRERTRRNFGGGKTGTQSDVLDAFIRGDLARSRKDRVPGDRRQRVGWAGPDEPGGTDLYSYRTVVARRSEKGDISLNPRRYSTTTSKMMGRLRRRMSELGYEPSGEQRRVHGVANMGRWGGAGLPWARDAFEDIMFEHHHIPKNRLR